MQKHYLMRQKIYFSLACLFSVLGNAQVGLGINTSNPRTDLDVNGSSYSNNIIAGSINEITAEEKDRYLLLTQSTTDNSIKKIDPRVSGSPGIATIATYKLQNVAGDWVEEFNTRINTTDFAVVILSAYFDRDLTLGSSGILAMPSFGVRNIGGFWNLYADYSGMAPASDGTWTFVCAIYPKTYVKLFEERTKDLGNTSSGTDASPILNQ